MRVSSSVRHGDDISNLNRIMRVIEDASTTRLRLDVGAGNELCVELDGTQVKMSITQAKIEPPAPETTAQADARLNKRRRR